MAVFFCYLLQRRSMESKRRWLTWTLRAVKRFTNGSALSSKTWMWASSSTMSACRTTTRNSLVTCPTHLPSAPGWCTATSSRSRAWHSSSCPRWLRNGRVSSSTCRPLRPSFHHPCSPCIPAPRYRYRLTHARTHTTGTRTPFTLTPLTHLVWGVFFSGFVFSTRKRRKRERERSMNGTDISVNQIFVCPLFYMMPYTGRWIPMHTCINGTVRASQIRHYVIYVYISLPPSFFVVGHRKMALLEVVLLHCALN